MLVPLSGDCHAGHKLPTLMPVSVKKLSIHGVCKQTPIPGTSLLLICVVCVHKPFVIRNFTNRVSFNILNICKIM